jgi:sulfotransferase family protein
MPPVEALDLTPEVRATLPTFFVIGAAKCGTTSLHSYIAAHPQIAMSSEKEPMYFVPGDWVERVARYKDLFERPASVRGESSTAYSAWPWAPEVPDRILAAVPDARLVYMVRDPIPRTLSHYAQNVWDRFPVRPFEELMSDLEDPMNMPVWSSRYATQLERWLRRFPSERILVLDQRDLLRERAATLRRVFAFLGVDAGFTSDSWEAKHNTADAHMVATAFGRLLGPAGPTAVRVPGLRRLVIREVPTPVLTPEQHERLAGILAPEADRLRALTGLSLDHWSV